MLAVIAKADPKASSSRAIHGAAKPMVENTSEGTKFLGTIGADGRMSMREMGPDEFVTTIQALPDILHASDQTDMVAISKLGVKVSQILLFHSGYTHPDVARIAGGHYER